MQAQVMYSTCQARVPNKGDPKWPGSAIPNQFNLTGRRIHNLVKVEPVFPPSTLSSEAYWTDQRAHFQPPNMQKVLALLAQTVQELFALSGFPFM
jgi:hypothetical protein